MRIFDPHIHMSARTTNDYAAMYLAGVRAVVEPAFWLGQPRTNVGSFVDYFDGLIGWERFRAAQYGIRHHATIGLNPKEANDPRCREVLAVLPRYLAKDGVVAVGELGGQPEADAEPVEAGLLAHRAGEGVELLEHPLEVFGRVHVGAVRELHQTLAPRSTELPSKVAPAAGTVGAFEASAAPEASVASSNPGTGSRCSRPLWP